MFRPSTRPFEVPCSTALRMSSRRSRIVLEHFTNGASRNAAVTIAEDFGAIAVVGDPLRAAPSVGHGSTRHGQTPGTAAERVGCVPTGGRVDLPRPPAACDGGVETKPQVRGGGDDESACRRGSVRRPKATGWPSIYAAYLGIVPPKRHRTGCPIPCSALLQVGFTEPPESPRALVRSYRTVSPLPVPFVKLNIGSSAVCFLWHFPAGHPDWPLASTLPCGAPTFLSREARQNRTTRPRPPGRLIVATILSRRPPWPRGQGARSRARLWNGHAGRPLSVVVRPPSDHRRSWSISQSAAGVSQ